MNGEATIMVLHCAECGEVPVASTEFELHICLVRPGVMEIVSAFFCVTCPGCGIYIARTVDLHGIALLRGYGISTQTFHPPAELLEPRPAGPPLQLDDVIDLHFELEEMFA